MRAELPWNVAGIPPEAREAARAAARREGLSVGEWLTRRILRSFSGMEEEMPSLSSFESRAPTGAPLDAWGMPPSAAARRDTEDMMARVGRSETESSDAWRRIEEQLRGLGRRIDSSERSHSESNRVLSRTAQEINISAREQAQVFDQLGLNVMALNERLERLERSAANDGIKEAVKALHQGLSRLADQITSTNNNSATQVTQLAGNLEQLAGRVGQARVDAQDSQQALEEKLQVTANALDQRLSGATAALEQRLAGTAASLEQRLAATEKTAQFNTNALDHALEKLEASANQRAGDQVDAQRRAALTEESIHRLEDAIARLEMRLPDAQFESRLEGIERSVTGMAQRLETYDPTEKFDSTMQALSHRLESLEKNHGELVSEVRTRQQPTYEPPPVYSYEAPAFAAEPPPVEQAYAEPFPSYAPPAPDAFAAPPTPGGFTFDIPPQTDAFTQPAEFGPEFENLFAAPAAEPENFLSQARRSARAASEKAQGEQRGRFAGLGWGKDTAEAEEKSRPRYVIPVAIALIAALAVAAGLVLMNRTKTVNTDAFPAKPPAQGGPTYSVPAPPDGDDTQFVVAPQAGSDVGNTGSQRSEPGAGEQSNPPRTAMPMQQRAVRNAPVNTVPDGGKAASSASPDRVIQMANAGNPIALTILGLQALDGTNGQAVNLPDAVKDLTQAAQKGQAVAQYRLGTLYERGQGVTADAAQAAHWYELSANQGNRKAMHNLAVTYASGTAGKKNMAEAARWFAKAAGLGLSDSQFNLAVLYERGDGVPQSLLDAFKWYTIAAAQGDTESKSRIAMLQSQLSDSDKAAAAKSAATFHAAPLVRSANVPPEPADLGG